MKKIISLFDVRKWQKDTKWFFGVIAAVILLMFFCSIFTPSEEDLKECASPTMQARLEEDAKKGEGAIKSVAVTYNDLFFINYCVFSTSGKAALKEAYLGFFGNVYDATKDKHTYLNGSYDEYTLVKTDSSGKQTDVLVSKDITSKKVGEGESQHTEYYDNGVLIPLEDGYTYELTEKKVKYYFVNDKLGNTIFSELNGDTIVDDEGIYIINGKVDEVEKTSVASVVGELVNYTYRLLGIGQSPLYGAKLTILLTVLAVFFGFILSVFFALGKISKIALFRIPCNAYVFFFRGTPLMIQIFVIYFAIPGITGTFSWKSLFPGDIEATAKGAFVAALIAFTLNTAAYCAEIVRAAIQSIDKGQFEAGKALGFTYGQTMSKIIIPQSIRRLIPPIANEFIMILKDASLVFVIGLQDITTISKVVSSEGEFLVFVPALAIYLIITVVFSFAFTKLEKRFAIYD